MIFKRRFGDLIDRQLDLFEQDNTELLQRISDAEDDYRSAGRDEAEERFGDLQDVVLEGTEILVALRDNYAATLGDEAAQEYEVAFNFGVLRRFPQFALELEDEEEEEG